MAGPAKPSLLKDHLRQSKTTEEGLRAFAADVAQRYPKLPPKEWELKKQVTCHWTVQFFSGTDKTVTLLMLPLLLLGHFHMKSSRLDFTTFHYLTSSETRRLRWSRALRVLLLPLVIFGMVAVGITLFIAICVLGVGLVTAFQPPTPQNPQPVKGSLLAGLGVAVLALTIFAIIRAQRKVSKMGQPLRTDDFQDQQILLRSVDII